MDKSKAAIWLGSGVVALVLGRILVNRRAEQVLGDLGRGLARYDEALSERYADSRATALRSFWDQLELQLRSSPAYPAFTKDYAQAVAFLSKHPVDADVVTKWTTIANQYARQLKIAEFH
jgi:hypothetical protein